MTSSDIVAHDFFEESAVAFNSVAFLCREGTPTSTLEERASDVL